MWLWYSHASGIIAVSHDVKNDLGAYLGRTKLAVDVIYNPVDYSRLSIDTANYQKTSVEIAGWRKTVESTYYLVVVGGLREAKGHSFAIDLLERLPVRYELIFVGDGPLLGQLEAKVRQNGLEGRVHFVGEYRNVTAWLTLAHTVLVPSRWEGFGLVIAEAAYLQARVIVSDVLGAREIARKVGAIICCRDVKSFASAILGEDLPAIQSRAWVSDFDPATVAAEYLKLLESK